MEGGLVSPVDEGTPQGGPLSPLLSNIVLDEFDRELERRGLRFARYADDSNIYVRSRRAGERVMKSLTRFITKKLRLKVNEQKSAVARPWARKFLGFSFTNAGIPKRRIAPKAVDRFKERVRELTSRTRGVSMERMAEELAAIFGAGLATSGSVKRRQCWKVLSSGSGAGYGLRSGSSGSEGRCGLPSYANGVWAKIWPLKRRAALMVRGGWRTARHSRLRCPMLTSTRSGFRDWLAADSSTRRTAGYGPACPVV